MSKKIKNLFLVPFLIIAIYLIFIFLKYDSIPDIIPIHGRGEKADSFGSKKFLFLPIIINLIFLFFVWLIIRNPKKMIKISNLDDNNKDEIYHNIQLILVIIALFFTIITTCLLFSDVVY